MSLFLTSLPAEATEETVRTTVLQSLPAVDPSSLRSVVHVAKSKYVFRASSIATRMLTDFRCAFINFKDRVSAEHAAQAWANGFDMDGETASVKWGRARAKAAPAATAAA
jgi:pre-mRNA-splicing factor RBM22/SLT11